MKLPTELIEIRDTNGLQLEIKLSTTLSVLNDEKDENKFSDTYAAGVRHVYNRGFNECAQAVLSIVIPVLEANIEPFYSSADSDNAGAVMSLEKLLRRLK